MHQSRIILKRPHGETWAGTSLGCLIQSLTNITLLTIQNRKNMLTNLILAQTNGAVCTPSLNRPDKLNAVNVPLIDAIFDSLKAVTGNKTIKVIIQKGEGRAFCAGADLNDEDSKLGCDEFVTRGYIETRQEITRQLLFSDKIVIDAIQAWAVGAALKWAINCDFPIWTESAKGLFPEAKWGLSVTGAITTLSPALVGPIKARELILLGVKHTAEEFYRLGIAWKVVPEDQPYQEATNLAEKLSVLGHRSLADLKRGINLGSYAKIEKALAFETEAYVAASIDAQTAKNITAFSSTQ